MNSVTFVFLAALCAIAVALDPKCSTTVSEGTGQDRTLKYFYNQELGHCLPFFRMGDCGTDNCFASDKDCMTSCSSNHQDIYPEEDAVCTLKMDPGSCFAIQAMYYYDAQEKICRMFLYTGCQGNGNRFESREECQKQCQAKSGRMLGSEDVPNPDVQTVDAGLIVGVLGGIVFAVALISAIVLFVKQRKAKQSEMKKVQTTELEMS